MPSHRFRRQRLSYSNTNQEIEALAHVYWPPEHKSQSIKASLYRVSQGTPMWFRKPRQCCEVSNHLWVRSVDPERVLYLCGLILTLLIGGGYWLIGGTFLEEGVLPIAGRVFPPALPAWFGEGVHSVSVSGWFSEPRHLFYLINLIEGAKIGKAMLHPGMRLRALAISIGNIE